MELNSSTFILEIINFLVLVWILKHFFYKPVLELIARRKASIDASLAKAELVQNEAQQLQQQYKDRLSDWAEEKQQAQHSLDASFQQERERQMEALQAELEAERQREDVLIQRKLEQQSQQILTSALQQGAQFASQLLSSVAGPEVENQLVKLLLEQLENLPQEQLLELRKTIDNHASDYASITSASITSAYALDPSSRATLEHACKEKLSVNGEFIYRQDPDLIAGLRINIGAWVLATNLQDELLGFVAFNNDN